eukprot:c9878_g1_i1.p1 GENE.c9878_g1_i1~~c9878_g1_i1.p1  ORF type:complete len:392 (+),score=104.90 c9878_g1_i1:733-1908(+)
MFAEVYERLESGGCVGVFPEGTSTDHTKMLEFQAGVAIIALGAKARGVDVKLQAVGLNYFHAHRWRSQAVMRFATPFTVPDDIVALNRTNKKEASRQLLQLIRNQLESVTFQVPSYEVARMIHIARSLYVGDRKVTIEERAELSRRFAVAYMKLSDRPELRPVFQEITEYANTLHHFHLSDHDVDKLTISPVKIAAHLLVHTIRILVCSPLVVIASVFITPLVVIANHKAADEMRRAKQTAPATKHRGFDVVASKKLVVGVSTMPWLLAVYVVVGVVVTEVILATRHSTAQVKLLRWLIPLVVCVGIPALLHVGLKASDYLWRSVAALRPVFLAVCNWRLGASLRAKRDELQRKVREKVEQFLPELEFGSRVLDSSVDPSTMTFDSSDSTD